MESMKQLSLWSAYTRQEVPSFYFYRWWSSHLHPLDQVGLYNLTLLDMEQALEAVMGSAKKGAEKDKPFVFKGFVNVNLTSQQKEQFRAWDYDDATAVDLMEGLLRNGYKCSGSWDSKFSAFIVTLTCKEPGDANYGLAMSGRAATLREAEAVTVFKHFAVLEQVWETPVESDEDVLG